MWVKCYTKGYPLLGIDNTQRAEAMFRALKHYVKTHFPTSKPVLKHLIPFIIPCMETKYLEKQFRVTNTRLKITHSNPRYNDALDDASEHVNEFGMRYFHDSILELEERRELLSVESKTSSNGDNEDIIIENYEGRLTSGIIAQYCTKETSCTCSRFSQKGLCLHMIFFRT